MGHFTIAHRLSVGGGGSVGVGSAFTGGSADRVPYLDGAGLLDVGELRFDEDFHAENPVLSINAAAVDGSASYFGGFHALVQITARHNGAGGLLVRQLGTGGNGNGAGATATVVWQMPNASLARADMYGSNFTGKFFGSALDSKFAIRSQAQFRLGTEFAHDLILGVNGAHATDATAARDTVTLRGDGSGVAFRRGIAVEPRRETTGPITVVAGEGKLIVDNNTGANINVTLPLHTALPDGFEFTLSTTTNCSGTNTVTLVAGAGATLSARITACGASEASRYIYLDKTAALWKLISAEG